MKFSDLSADADRDPAAPQKWRALVKDTWGIIWSKKGISSAVESVLIDNAVDLGDLLDAATQQDVEKLRDILAKEEA